MNIDDLDRENLSLCVDRQRADAQVLGMRVDASRIKGEDFGARRRGISDEIARGRAEFDRARRMFDLFSGKGE
jgi:hypothetical protein